MNRIFFSYDTTGGKKQPEKSGNYNKYSSGYSQKFFNMMTSGFSKMAVFARFFPIWRIWPFLPVLYTSSGTTGDNKQPEKSGNYNLYSNG